MTVASLLTAGGAVRFLMDNISARRGNVIARLPFSALGTRAMMEDKMAEPVSQIPDRLDGSEAVRQPPGAMQDERGEENGMLFVGEDGTASPTQTSALFPKEQCQALSQEWQTIQAGFVDSPRASVQKADALVKKTIDTLESSFADMHSGLERNWEKDKPVSTEDLRLALQNYRSFFQRLLSV